ncbi:HAMP domain-containing histidine kinase [Paenibacillus sp. MER TA 81-3]|uniref:sensor histidine kinase n=1 Tax=Paenibacillus sp. MER TA 81-3 TaxID=2939573 RepID=UPI00203ECCFE|nr:HAMP domain-containing sensor histidine kinase [Paenibacillus sp. MER TA 81-3]MCM3342782.1 HAMP domain-containing histidine kinase [Paenibacillus sp. MER TA 81-3]
MDFLRKGIVIGLFLLIIGLFVQPSCLWAASSSDLEQLKLSQWDVLWEASPLKWEDVANMEEGWREVNIARGIPSKPERIKSAWFRITLPATPWDESGLYIDKLYAFDVEVYTEDGRKIFEASRDYSYDIYQILVPLVANSKGQDIFIHASTSSDKFGIHSEITIGNYQDLLPLYVNKGLLDIILGGALVFAAIVMLSCTLFLRNIDVPSWLSLSLVILSFGVLMITYSRFTYTFFSEYGKVFAILFDLGLMILFPALSYYFEIITGPGPRRIITKFRKFQVAYASFILLVLFSNLISDNAIYSVYFFLTVTVLAFIIVIQLVVLLSVSVLYVLRKNKDVVLFAIGFTIFAMTSIAELIWFLIRYAQYELTLWKWGSLCFVLALILILGRRVALNHERVIQYSKELEMYNGKLQHSEKMEILSELAASVAHEVRNPLQVTRGFLQLLDSKAAMKEKEYLKLALTELDRASAIITDFLTFAKPELEDITVLNVGEELSHIEGILIPLANMQGGVMTLDMPPNLCINGNSSKFKQAFINLIKNSIEALTEKGWIRIWGYEQEGKVTIHILDNGAGMDEQELSRLGEPYFSNKTKGTGLGLMVTLRIIEVMQGEIKFTSKKGVGTEVVIRFPSVYEKAM